MISDKRKQSLATKFIFKNTFNSKDLDKLSIQELFFLIKSCDSFKNEMGFDKDVLNERISLFEDCSKNKLTSLNVIYALLDNTTSYLFYNDIDSVELYSQEEYAKRALDYYVNANHRKLSLVSYKQEEFNELFCEINRLGFKHILVDKGQFSYQYECDSLLRLKNCDESLPHMCRDLMEICIKFFSQIRWLVNYQGKENILDNYQKLMFIELKIAKYLIPIKRVSITYDEELMLHIAKIMNNQNSLSYLPIFSDWVEFEKMYDKEEYDCLIMSLEDLVDLVYKTKSEGLIFNPKGIDFVINRNLINAVLNNELS